MKIASRVGLIVGAAVGGTVGIGLLQAEGAAVRCAWITESTQAIVRFEAHADVCPPDRLHKDIAWLPAPEVPAPPFDPETEIREGPSYVVGATEVTESWNVRAKTAPEIDAEKDALVADGPNDKLVYWNMRRTTEQVQKLLEVAEALRRLGGFSKAQVNADIAANPVSAASFKNWLEGTDPGEALAKNDYDAHLKGNLP